MTLNEESRALESCVLCFALLCPRHAACSTFTTNSCFSHSHLLTSTTSHSISTDPPIHLLHHRRALHPRLLACAPQAISPAPAALLPTHAATPAANLPHTSVTSTKRPPTPLPQPRPPHTATNCTTPTASKLAPSLLFLPSHRPRSAENTAKLSSTILQRGGITFADRVNPSPPLCVQSAERKMSSNSKDKNTRRRRSSSLMYQEPPESLEQQSDQAILPNLNAQWVNAKGEAYQKECGWSVIRVYEQVR